jgi:hypothetical protein
MEIHRDANQEEERSHQKSNAKRDSMPAQKPCGFQRFSNDKPSHKPKKIPQNKDQSCFTEPYREKSFRQNSCEKIPGKESSHKDKDDRCGKERSAHPRNDRSKMEEQVQGEEQKNREEYHHKSLGENNLKNLHPKNLVPICVFGVF